MKSRLAAALALLSLSICACSKKPSVGWYVMLPPPLWQNNPIADNPSDPDTNAPLSRWDFLAWLDAAQQCQDYRKTALPGLERGLLEMMKGRGDGEKLMADDVLKKKLDKSVCIASNDPRMRGIRTPMPSQIGR
jgi:hypothetical protein